MKYVLLGTLSTDWAAKHGQRVESATAKLKELGITLEAVYYTQGQYDFVDVVDAPEPEALLTRPGRLPQAWRRRARRPGSARRCRGASRGPDI